jgi:transposase
VTDNAPFHNVQIHAAPNSNSRKADMINWLQEKNIIFDRSMLKPQLYELIKINKKRHIRYKFDEVMLAHGHTVLRLPPYHPDLNPIELIWATVKNNVSKKNITFKLEDVRKLAGHEFDQITPEEWQKRCQHVINIEQKYLENEAFTDIHTEINPLIINLNDDSSTSSSESEENHYWDSTE